MRGILSEGPGRGALDDGGLAEFSLHALTCILNAIDDHAEMIESSNISIPQGIDVEAQVAIPDRDTIQWAAGFAGLAKFQTQLS